MSAAVPQELEWIINNDVCLSHYRGQNELLTKMYVYLSILCKLT